MTDTPHPTMQRTATYHLRAFAGRKDGTSAGDVMDLDVTVQFTAGELRTNPHDQAVEQIGAWLDTYYANRDLSDVLDFAPTTDNLAIWVARMAEQFAGESSFTSATVTHHRVGGPSISSTVAYR